MRKCNVDELQAFLINDEKYYLIYKDDDIEDVEEGQVSIGKSNLYPKKDVRRFDFIVCPRCKRVLFSCYEEYIGKNINEILIPLIKLIHVTEPLDILDSDSLETEENEE